MKYPRWSTAALALACLAAFVCSSQPVASYTKGAAPADEYFGKMKMSYLGINNSLRDAYVMAGEHTTFPVVIQKVMWAENALLDWQHRYPNDPQLPRSLFFLMAAYLKIWTGDGQSHALAYVTELRDRYGKTYFGKLVKADLAKGLTVHVFDAAQPCVPVPGAPTPTPAPMPTADPKYNIRVEVVPAPCFTPPPTPAPTPIPTLIPTPMPAASPVGSAAPSATPTGARSPAPSASPASPASSPASPASTSTPAPQGSATPSGSPPVTPSSTPTATPKS
jgi:hypothetical protein